MVLSSVMSSTNPRSLFFQMDETTFLSALLGSASLGIENCSNVHRSAFLGLSGLRVRLVLALTTHVGHVKLNLNFERALAVGPAPCFADALHHESSCCLGNARVTAQFHRGNRLEIGQAQIDSDCPAAVLSVGSLHDSVGFYQEETLAVGAAVRHLLVSGFAYAEATALRAMSDVLADLQFEKFRCSFFGREDLPHPNYGYAVGMGLSRAGFGISNLRVILQRDNGAGGSNAHPSL